MNRKFTKLMAALALLVGLAIPLGMWGQTTVASFSRSGSTNSITGGTFSYAAEQRDDFYQDGGSAGATRYLQIKNNSAYWTTTPTSISFAAKVGGGSGNKDLANPVNVSLLDADGNVIVSTTTVVTSHITTNTGDDYNISIPVTNNVYGVRISHVKESGFNVRYFSFSLSYVEGTGPQTESHTLTFSANPTEGGTVTVGSSTSGSITLEENATVNISATPAELGYAFNNWTVSGTGASVDNASNASTTFTMGTADATLTANFSTVTTYSITYKANGPEAEDVVDTYNEGATVTVRPANTFTYSAHSFTGWNTEADGSGDSYVAEGTIESLTGNLVLYAQWEESSEITATLNIQEYGTAHNWTNGTQYTSVTIDEVTFKADYTGSNNNTGKYYSNVTPHEWRYYQTESATITISVPDAYHLVSITPTYNPNNDGVLLNGSTSVASGSTVSVSGQSVTFSVGNSGTATNGQVRFTNIVVIYESEGGTPAPSFEISNNEELAYNATSGSFNFTVNNPVEGGYTTVSEEVAWISNPAVNNNTNTVSFDIETNPAAGPREGVVTLTYHYGEETKTHDVTVTQAGNPNVFDNISSINTLGTQYAVKGTVVATNARGFVIGDGTGYVYYYKGDAPTQIVGNMVTISGHVTSYGHILQFSSSGNNDAVIGEATTSNYDGTPAITVVDATAIADYNEDYQLSDYVQYEGTLTKTTGNNTYYNIAVGTATARISYQTSTQATALEALLNKTVRVKGYFAGFSGDYFTTMMESVEEVAVPTITLVPDNPIYTVDGYHLEFAYYSHGGGIDKVQPANFQDELTLGDFNIQYYDANSQPIETPDWLTGTGAEVVLLGNELYLSVAVKPNNTGAERSCYFKVWALNGTTKVYSDLVTVHQADKPVINANDIVLTHDATSGSIAYTISNPIANTSLTATLQEGIDWISNINVGETAVTFNTTANTGAIRTANITLTYKDTQETHATKVVTVTQILPSVTGTITFGSGVGSTNINKASVTGKDSLENEWTITTTGTQSYTPNQNYAQVGSSGDPAETITFTTSLGAGTTIASIEAKFGGFSSTAGDINLFVDNTNVGEGTLNGTTDVTVQSTTTQEGNAITVTVSNIAKGVKCYYISYSYVASTAPYITAEAALPLAYDATSGSIAYEIGNPVEGGVLTATINDGSTIADLAIGTITNTAVPFTCLANTATTEHTATITLTYKDANNQILATKEVTLTQDRVPMQNVTMAFHPTAAMATIGIAEFTAPTLTIDPAGLTVTYSSSNPTVATVDETSGVVTIGNSAGITEITATFAGNDAYYPASALYTLFVNDNPNIPILTVDEEYITPTTAPVLWTPCASVTSYTLDLAPVAISESFEEGLIPEGWTKPETNVSIASGKGGDGDYCVAFKAKDAYLITPALNNPKAISFMYKRSGNSTDWSLDISCATSLNAETWTNIGTVDDATTTWKTYSASLDVTGEVYIKFTDTRSTGTHERYIDLVQIAGEYTSQSVTGTSYTFENLAAGATYYARVKGNSDYSNVVSFTTLPFTLDIAGYGDSTKDGYYLIASPVGVVTPTAANGFLTSEYDLYIFDESQNSAEWRNYEVMTEGDNPQHANFSTLEPGKGYLYASETNTTLKFTGTPYDGEGMFELSKTEGNQLSGWNLVGNPFATDASIDKKDFYVMNEAGNEIVPAENSTIAPMQGIFILAEEGDNVTFTRGSTGAFDQSITAQVSQNRGNVIDRVRVRFGEGRQLPKFMLNSDNTKLYIPQGNKDYAVVRSANEGEMPVNFKASKAGNYTISVNAENTEMNYLHLIDNMTGADIDLLAEPAYTFEAKTSDYPSRFRLVFSGSSTSSETAETFAYFNGSEWSVSNMGEATLQVVDMLGRIVKSETINGNATMSTNNLGAGVYVMRLINGENVMTQKIVVR